LYCPPILKLCETGVDFRVPIGWEGEEMNAKREDKPKQEEAKPTIKTYGL